MTNSACAKIKNQSICVRTPEIIFGLDNTYCSTLFTILIIYNDYFAILLSAHDKFKILHMPNVLTWEERQYAKLPFNWLIYTFLADFVSYRQTVQIRSASSIVLLNCYGTYRPKTWSVLNQSNVGTHTGRRTFGIGTAKKKVLFHLAAYLTALSTAVWSSVWVNSRIGQDGKHAKNGWSYTFLSIILCRYYASFNVVYRERTH